MKSDLRKDCQRVGNMGIVTYLLSELLMPLLQIWLLQ